MGARALDDLAVGVDQRVGLARQGRDLDREFALQPLGAAGADIGDGIGDALQRREAKADLEDRGQHQHDRQRRKRAAEIIVEGAGFLENLGGVAGHHHQEFAVGAEIDRPLHHAQGLAFGAVDIADADAGRGQLDALLLELGQLLVPQRARRAHVGFVAVGAGDLPVPARQRQFEQRLAERLELVGRRIRGRYFGDDGAQIEIEPAVEGALAGRAIHRRQHDAGDQQDHHHPCGRRNEQPGGERTGAARKLPLGLSRIHQESFGPKRGRITVWMWADAMRRSASSPLPKGEVGSRSNPGERVAD